ncbi:Y-family DNA polymerase [Paenibacillus sp. FSL R10-2748]|uniref:Y-family DNA polymerase n=1 Tax=Paenibacillus sp. FSL R10-2748 TaxID=2954658 RepID=UPI0030F5C040
MPPDPRIQMVNAQMGLYLDTSMTITKLLNQYVPTEAISTYSVDESWITLDATAHLHGTTLEAVQRIQKDILMQLRLPSTAGIGPNKLLAKLELDNYSKKTGIAECTYQDIPHLLWPPLVKDIWGIERKMKKRINSTGIYQQEYTIRLALLQSYSICLNVKSDLLWSLLYIRRYSLVLCSTDLCTILFLSHSVCMK